MAPPEQRSRRAGENRPLRRGLTRLAYGVGAFVLTDLVVGLVVFSVLVLGIFCFFSISWIGLAAEAAARGLTFGTEYQLRLAMGVMVVAPAMALLVVYLGIQAFLIPRRAWRLARGFASFAPRVGLVAPRIDSRAGRPPSPP